MKLVLHSQICYIPKLLIRHFSGLLFLLVLLSTSLHSQSPLEKDYDGELLFSGSEVFTESWTSSTESRNKGLWWQGSFYTQEEERNYQPWESTVKNSVSPFVGQITVTGPSSICLMQTSNRARIKMYDVETGQGFIPCPLEGVIENGFFNHGFVPKGVEMTIDVYAVMAEYNNQINTGEFAYHAPQDVEYELWYFPRGEGSDVKITSSDTDRWDKPQPGILYFTDKKCN